MDDVRRKQESELQLMSKKYEEVKAQLEKSKADSERLLQVGNLR